MGRGQVWNDCDQNRIGKMDLLSRDLKMYEKGWLGSSNLQCDFEAVTKEMHTDRAPFVRAIPRYHPQFNLVSTGWVGWIGIPSAGGAAADTWRSVLHVGLPRLDANLTSLRASADSLSTNRVLKRRLSSASGGSQRRNRGGRFGRNIMAGSGDCLGSLHE